MSRHAEVATTASSSGRPCPELSQWKPCPATPCYNWQPSSWTPCQLHVNVHINSLDNQKKKSKAKVQKNQNIKTDSMI